MNEGFSIYFQVSFGKLYFLEAVRVPGMQLCVGGLFPFLTISTGAALLLCQICAFVLFFNQSY